MLVGIYTKIKQGLVNIYKDMHLSVNVYLLIKAEIHTKFLYIRETFIIAFLGYVRKQIGAMLSKLKN